MEWLIVIIPVLGLLSLYLYITQPWAYYVPDYKERNCPNCRYEKTVVWVSNTPIIRPAHCRKQKCAKITNPNAECILFKGKSILKTHGQTANVKR